MTKSLKEAFNTKVLVSVLVAFVAYTVARLLQNYVLGRIQVLAKIPEVADAITMIGAATLIKGDARDAALVGSGLSLLNHLGERTGITWLKIS